MPNLALAELQHLNTIDPSGRLLKMMQQLEGAVNNVGGQVNAAPVGSTGAPPKISSVTAVALSAGVHKVQIHDNNPATRGLEYHFEFSTTQNFEPGTVVLSQSGPSRDHIISLGAGPIFWRAYSQYGGASPPSAPVYAGGSVDAGGGARTAAITGAGSGTESSLQPQPGAGFGFTPDRSPRLPK